MPPAGFEEFPTPPPGFLTPPPGFPAPATSEISGAPSTSKKGPLTAGVNDPGSSTSSASSAQDRGRPTPQDRRLPTGEGAVQQNGNAGSGLGAPTPAPGSAAWESERIRLAAGSHFDDTLVAVAVIEENLRLWGSNGANSYVVAELPGHDSAVELHAVNLGGTVFWFEPGDFLTPVNPLDLLSAVDKAGPDAVGKVDIAAIDLDANGTLLLPPSALKKLGEGADSFPFLLPEGLAVRSEDPDWQARRHQLAYGQPMEAAALVPAVEQTLTTAGPGAVSYVVGALHDGTVAKLHAVNHRGTVVWHDATTGQPADPPGTAPRTPPPGARTGTPERAGSSGGGPSLFTSIDLRPDGRMLRPTIGLRQMLATVGGQDADAFPHLMPAPAVVQHALSILREPGAPLAEEERQRKVRFDVVGAPSADATHYRVTSDGKRLAAPDGESYLLHEAAPGGAGFAKALSHALATVSPRQYRSPEGVQQATSLFALIAAAVSGSLIGEVKLRDELVSDETLHAAGITLDEQAHGTFVAQGRQPSGLAGDAYRALVNHLIQGRRGLPGWRRWRPRPWPRS